MKKSFNKSFEKTLLDTNIPNLRLKIKDGKVKGSVRRLPKPLKPTKYVPPVSKKSVPKPRILSKRPVPLPRPKPVSEKVKKLIDEITPYYKPEAISEFNKILRDPKSLITEKDRALRNTVKSFEVAIIEGKDPTKQLYYTTPDVAKELERQQGGFKAYVTLHITFKKKKIVFGETDGQEGQPEEVFEFKNAYFNSKAFTILNREEIEDALDKAAEEINNKIAVWLSEGSGWTIEVILQHYVNIAKYLPLRGNSYLPLPEELRNSKKGLINLKNEDDKCFLWCLVRHLNPIKVHPERITQSDREFAKNLDFNGITFPVTVKQISQIERQNKIKINVFGYNRSVFPIRITKEKYDDQIDLLYIEREVYINKIEGNVVKFVRVQKQHYVYIKDFNSLMYQFNNHKERKHFCKYCLHAFKKIETLEKHKPNCLSINGVQAIELPKKYVDKNGVERNPSVYFKNHRRILPVPFVIYADFESIIEKISTCQPSDVKSYTDKYQKHTTCSFGYKVVCHYDKKYSKDVVIYRGEDAINKFMKCMFREVKCCQTVIKENFNKPLQMTRDDEINFKKATHCHICEKKYNPCEKENIPVRDHCHVTGKYRGSAHKDCNLKLQISAEKTRIPVIFHNLRGYDSHFIMQEIGKIINEENLEIKERNEEKFKESVENNKNLKKDEFEHEKSINVIPCNAEKYMAFYIDKLAFIDSFQFMSSSLERLASNLSEDRFIYTKQHFIDRFKLMTKKGVYPYNYMDSFNKFNESYLPKIEDFYSSLTDENISNNDYNHAQNVWNTFQIRNMGEYHDLYLKSDILLLTDVFENFRKTCLTNYRLDPAHYVSSPGLAWDAMLKMTKINLELITDIDMQLFIEKGMRGGISCITHRHAKANNKYMKNYNPDIENSYNIYLDANNLYGWGMSQSLPCSNFRWFIDSENKSVNNWLKYINTKKLGIGKIYEVDLEYPKHLHDLHNDYPCAAQKIKVSDDMLSDYCKEIKDKYKISSGNIAKLIPNLYNKEKYVLHERNLKLYLKLGLKLKEVHRVLEFTEKPWLKTYIDFNTNMRKEAKNSFEKDFFKLMNNSVFGKTMENLRKRCNVKLVTDKDQLIKLSSKPTYVSSKIFNENLVAVNMIKEQLKLNKPSYVGMCILDLSKVLMYDFHYNFIKKNYNKKAKLLFTDTDSLCYHIQTDDVYEDLYYSKDLFDNSDYPKSSKYFFDNNKKVIGKFKDEAAGHPIIEFIGLKSKMYSYKTETKNSKTAKGVKKNVINRDLNHSDYKDTLFNDKIMQHKMKSIRSDHHQVSSYEINKTSLSCFDDKRYILNDGISSYAYGHYMIKNDKAKDII